MIADIFFDWNVLTATLVAWSAVVSLTLGIDFGPEVYREHKARRVMETVTLEKIAARRQAEKPITFDPDATFQLGVYKIEKSETARRRHAKV